MATSWAERAVQSAMGGLSTCVEGALSARCLMAVFLAACAMLSVSGWLRPPVSNDLLAIEIPFGTGGDGRLGRGDAGTRGRGDGAKESTIRVPRPFAASQSLRTPHSPPASTASRSVRIGSIGAVLLLVIAVGAGFVAVRKERFPVVCGVLFALSLAGNAAAAWNHPATIESLGVELGQAARVKRALSDHYDSTLGQQGLRGLQPGSSRDKMDRAGLTAGVGHLQYGLWLTVLTAVGLLCATPGGTARRFGVVGVWGLLGVALALSLCRQRLQGESLWRQAVRSEQRGGFDGSREFAQQAIAVMPEFEDLHRTWFLLGQLDYRDGRPTPARRYFHLYQLVAAKDRAAARHECDLLIRDSDGGEYPLLAELTGRLLCDEGLQDFSEGRYAAAEEKWRRALELAPSRLDSPFLLALVHAVTSQDRPEQAEAYLKPLLPRLRDRALKAEIWSTLGDSYFESGRFEVARTCYRQSLRQFNLPKTINHRALKGLVGM